MYAIRSYYVSCPNAEDGAIIVTVLGGTEPYLYTWNTGLSRIEVGNSFRELVKAFMDGTSADEMLGAIIHASFEGTPLTGALVANEA